MANYRAAQLARAILARQARLGRVAAFGTLRATSPILSRIQRELNARRKAERKEAKP